MGGKNATENCRDGRKQTISYLMIDLSAEEINKISPYKLTKIETNSFVFETKFGLRYNVGFAEDYSFLEEGVYQFYIVNLSHDHAQEDSLVKETICALLEAFFNAEPATMLYICDTSDNRQEVRDRLFRNWFSEYAYLGAFTMINECITFDGVRYFASIMLRNDHPQYENIKNAFRDFVKDLPLKIDQLQDS